MTSSMLAFIGFTPSLIILSTVSGFIFFIKLLSIALTVLTLSIFSFVISILFAARTLTASRSSLVPSSPSSLIISSALPFTAFLRESPRSLLTCVPTASYVLAALSNILANTLSGLRTIWSNAFLISRTVSYGIPASSYIPSAIS